MSARQVRPPQRPDASMSLLNDVMYRPVDAGYAEAAARPVPVRTPAARTRRATAHLVVAVALGLVTASAVASLRTPEPVGTGARSLLQEQIADRTAEADALQATNEQLAAEVAQIQSDALASADPELFATLAELEVLSGSTGLEGSGLVLELTDAPVTDPDDVDPRRRVQDIDLQIVTNGLWAAGAEGIAINGQRLTGSSAIRGVGPAVLVDLVPLVSPYRIEVVGDAQAMQTAFARTTAANHLTTLTGNFEIGVSLRAGEVELPGGTTPTLRHAVVPGTGVAQSVAATSEEGTS
ncbi:DUF881 domain-containing protein [Actinotalea ferrariae]|uniref:DUF881 domain-containing protein n=1 Tax=Actinotalea ferrariae TaxID=1386098 RepID=UPI001C8BBF48|nr:DUF881 domain-containing protein [Actinotalea ferrariae]MBX9245094.1 DUF881 domain-containing protein [Actinotalea ferrariae]